MGAQKTPDFRSYELPVDPGRILFHHPRIPRLKLVQAARRRAAAETLLTVREALRLVGYELVPRRLLTANGRNWRRMREMPRINYRGRAFYLVPQATAEPEHRSWSWSDIFA